MQLIKQRIAVPTSNGKLDAHFGHCNQFTLIDISENQTNTTVIDAPPHQPNLLPKFLAEQEVTDVIAGGMGPKAVELFNARGINVMVGAAEDTPENIVKGFLDGTLSFTENNCNH